MTLALSRSVFGFFLWLALAIVLAPALDPVGSPFREATGSAFNAFTSDVSLGPSRAAPPERERKYRALPADQPDHARPAVNTVVPAAFARASRTALAVAPTPSLQSDAGPGLTSGRAFPARAPPSFFLHA